MKRIIARIKGFDIKRMFKMIKVICQRSGESFIHIFLDIFRCWIKFGSGYMDYYLFYFETLDDSLKETYINIGVNKEYIRECNDPNYYHVLNNKIEFLNTYKEFIKRDYLDISNDDYEAYLEFIGKHKEFMAKPVNGLCGYGIELIKTDEHDPKELYDTLKQNGQLLLEERIKQNIDVDNIYSGSINTIRIVTLNKNDEVSILFRAMRIGNKGKVVDNFNNGGLMAVVEEDGTIVKPLLDKDNNVYTAHPMTGTQIVGFKIPHFNEVIELCKELARVTPELGLCGWDIAITDKGVDVVEGNEIPGYDIYQSREQLNEDRKGIKERFDNAIYPERKDKKIFAKGYNFSKAIWIAFFSIAFEYLLSLININVPLFFDTMFAYIFLYKHIDTRPFKKTIIYIFIYFVFCFCINYLLINYAAIENVFLEFNYAFKNLLPELVKSSLIVLIRVYLFSLFILYFGLPLIDKFVEKIPNTLGKFSTIIVAIGVFAFIAIIITLYVAVIVLAFGI